MRSDGNSPPGREFDFNQIRLDLFVVLDAFDRAGRAVDPAALRIVREHHNLRPDFHRERHICRQSLIIENAFDRARVDMLRALKLRQFAGIALRGHGVGRHEIHGEVVARHGFMLDAAAVESTDILVSRGVIADSVEKADKLTVSLAVNLF